MSEIILQIAFWILGPITVVAYGCMAATVIPPLAPIRDSSHNLRASQPERATE